MKNVWSDQQLTEAVQAEKAAIHNKRAAEYYEAGNAEMDIHHELFAVTHPDLSAILAEQAN
jgi:PPE-repeat protein